MIFSFDRFVESKYFGIHKVKVKNPDNGKVIEVMAKFDTGAKFSSICISLAKKLGFSDSTIDSATNNHIDSDNQEITTTKTLKSANGVSERIFVDLDIDHTDGFIKTQVSITDRSHMNYSMIIGLKDMYQVV